MSILEKLTKGFGKKAQVSHTNAEAMYTTKLQKILYDEELIKEYAPIFAELSQHEGFDKVFEILESKESQLEQLAGGEWTEQQENKGSKEQDDDEDGKEKPLTADEILALKYTPKEN